MESKTGKILEKLILPLTVAVLVGMGSSALTGMTIMARLEERVIHLERKAGDHVKETTETVVALRAKDNDYERRLSKIEAFSESTQRILSEIGADVKMILKTQKFPAERGR